MKGEKMETYYCWYDNGTGWYEGPFQTRATNKEEALANENLANWQYGTIATTARLYDPNQSTSSMWSAPDPPEDE
jgi:hypothetical protein